MSVIRIQKTNNYTVMSNYHFREKDMSLKAKGLLSLMLSLPEEWDYSVDGLVKLSKDGKDSVISAITELEQFGYLVRSQAKGQDGKFAGYDYDVYEQPYTEKPFTENPSTVKPMTENPQQLNTKPLNTESDINITNKKLNINVQTEQEFEEVWKIYPRKEDKKKAFSAYKTARKKASFDEIKKGVETYSNHIRVSNTDKRYIKLGATYFNGECWANNYEQSEPKEELIKGKYTRAQVEEFAKQLNISYEKALKCC